MNNLTKEYLDKTKEVSQKIIELKEGKIKPEIGTIEGTITRLITELYELENKIQLVNDSLMVIDNLLGELEKVPEKRVKRKSRKKVSDTTFLKGVYGEWSLRTYEELVELYNDIGKMKEVVKFIKQTVGKSPDITVLYRIKSEKGRHRVKITTAETIHEAYEVYFTKF